MLIIRHRTGPLAGQETRVEARNDRVVFGRDPDACDVVFPPDATLVSRHHFALVRRPSGDWTIDLFGTPFVAVNSEPAEQGLVVRSGARFELGRRGGPSFELTMEGESKQGGLAMTLAQEPMTGARTAAAKAVRAAARARTFSYAGLALVLLLALGGGAFYYQYWVSGQQLASQLLQLNEAQARFAADNIPREYRDRLVQAAHLVIIRDAAGRERGDATAFPIGPHLFATAAHVADNRDDFKSGEKMLVRAPGQNGRTWEVVEHKKHPAYKPLDDFLSRDSMYIPSTKSRDEPTGLRQFTSVYGYDVAILRVEGPPLSPILELATPEEIAKLKPGDPLAYAGYPQQDIIGAAVNVLGATPEVRTGLVTALTDFFAMPADAAQSRLVHHNMGTTVGASGSPIISTSGHVVALHTKSNYMATEGGKLVPSGALINYGQRSDMLADLLSGKAAASLDLEKAYWQKQTAKLVRGYDAIIGSLLDGLKPNPSATPTLAKEEEDDLDEEDEIKTRGKDGTETVTRQKPHEFKVTRGSDHAFIAYAKERARISLYLFVDKKLVKRVEGHNWYPALAYHATKDTTVEVYVSSGTDDDVEYKVVDYVFEAPKS
jgi:V8-like Glu-specific endopeptidase